MGAKLVRPGFSPRSEWGNLFPFVLLALSLIFSFVVSVIMLE